MPCHKNLKTRPFSRLTIYSVLLAFGLNILGPLPKTYAQVLPELGLPNPGMMIGPSPAFVPVILRGIKIHPDNPFQFDFIVDTGTNPSPWSSPQGGEDSGEGALEKESTKLIKYFLAALTVPEDDLWVNLSPYEKDRIIPEAFGQTEMGRDLLAQDYILKQLTASLMYPENDLGKEFWQKVYQKAQELYGTTEIPINTFNKVWIVPDKAEVYETEDTAFVTEAHLKVMLEGDYLALQNNLNQEEIGTDQLDSRDVEQLSDVSSQIVKEIILPEIEKEVNHGKNFAQLRQIYNSLILAAWFKRALKDSILNKIYTDQNKIAGVDIEDKEAKQKIYNQYLEAFKKGVYDYIKEDYDPATQEIIPRRYFSGGFDGPAIGEKLKRTKPGDPAAMGIWKKGIALIAGIAFFMQVELVNAADLPGTAPVVKANTETVAGDLVALPPGSSKGRVSRARGPVDLTATLVDNPTAFRKLRQKIKTTIKDDSVKLAIQVHGVVDVNAAKGLIQALNLAKSRVLILYGGKIDSNQARKFFPGYEIRTLRGFFEQGVIEVEFYDDSVMEMTASKSHFHASLPYVPFKFNLPQRVSQEELDSMRKSLGIGPREVIVLGSPSNVEFDEFMQVYNVLYNSLSLTKRPLVIVGFRQIREESELKLLRSLSGQGIAVRSDSESLLPNVAGNNVLILNTAGELLKIYGLANVAIVGNDRNIFEPVSQGATTLFFKGSSANNQEAKETLVRSGAVKIFNRHNLSSMLTDDPSEAKEMAAKGLKAVSDYSERVQSRAEEFALQIIGSRMDLIDKFISSSPEEFAEVLRAIKETMNNIPEGQRYIFFEKAVSVAAKTALKNIEGGFIAALQKLKNIPEWSRVDFLWYVVPAAANQFNRSDRTRPFAHFLHKEAVNRYGISNDMAGTTTDRDDPTALGEETFKGHTEGRVGRNVAARAVDTNAQTPGGIDVRKTDAVLKTKGEGVKFDLPAGNPAQDPWPLSPADLQNLPGLTPVIFQMNIIPIQQLPEIFLGITQAEKDEDLSLLESIETVH